MVNIPPSPVQSRHPDLAHLVESFYAVARDDALLGPVFAAAIHDWPHHLRALTGFWAAQLRGRGTYRGSPMAAHRALAQQSGAARLTPAMFERWLSLWRETTAQTMPPAEAAILQAQATRIAQVMRQAIAP
jgi:hemoglobin